MSRLSQLGKVGTTIHTDESGEIVVTYHHTEVVRFNAIKIVLNTGSWQTHTTKARMNQASNQFKLGYRVYQMDYSWYVDFQGQTHNFDKQTLILYR